MKTLPQGLFYPKKKAPNNPNKNPSAIILYNFFPLYLPKKIECFLPNAVTVSLTSRKLLISYFKTVLTFSYFTLGAERSMAWWWVLVCKIQLFLKPKTCFVNRLGAVAGLDYLHHVTVDFMERNKKCCIRNMKVHQSIELIFKVCSWFSMVWGEFGASTAEFSFITAWK